MKKYLTKLLLLLVAIVPTVAFADFLNYSLGSINMSENGVAYIPISVTGSAKITGNLTCTATNGLSCSVEYADGHKFYEYNEIERTDGGDLYGQIGRLVIRNNTTNEKTGTVKLYEDGEYEENRVCNPVDVTVKGQKAKSNNSKLTQLKTEVGTLSPSFSSDVYAYTLYGIPDSNRRFKFYYNCDNCAVTISGGVKTDKSSQDGYSGAWFVELNQGENAIDVKVTSEDGNSTSTYKINAIRGDNGYNSSKLKSLSIDGFDLDPKFDKDTLEYKVSISKKVSNITKLLKYEAEDSEAKVKVTGADELDNDEGEVTIEVTNRSGETTKYVLKVTKDLTDSVIEVVGYKDNKVTYIDTEGVSQTVSETDFEAQYPDEWAKIKDGTYKFDEDGNIIKEKNEDTNNSVNNDKKKSFPWIIVILIILALAIIGVSGYFIFRDPSKAKNKKKKGNKDGEEEPKEIPEDAKEELEDIDTYNEEARLIAEDNIRKENSIPFEETLVDDAMEEVKEEVAGALEEEKSPTMDIDEALSDLMNTKEYNFKDK